MSYNKIEMALHLYGDSDCRWTVREWSEDPDFIEISYDEWVAKEKKWEVKTVVAAVSPEQACLLAKMLKDMATHIEVRS